MAVLTKILPFMKVYKSAPSFRGIVQPFLPFQEEKHCAYRSLCAILLIEKQAACVVVREFSGDKTMREAFEQLIERQTCEHFEECLEHREMAQKAA